MLKVGITGGIGSGKSLVCKIFSSLNVPIYDADSRAKALMVEDQDLINGLIAAFGEETYIDGELNREYLSSKVFNNEDAIRQLNGLVHPAVFKDAEQWMLRQARQGSPYAIKEAALLVETGSNKQLDALIVVTAPEQIRINRVVERDGMSREEVMARMSKQLSEDMKIAVADHVINNDGKAFLIEQVWEIHQKLLSKAG